MQLTLVFSEPAKQPRTSAFTVFQAKKCIKITAIGYVYTNINRHGLLIKMSQKTGRQAVGILMN